MPLDINETHGVQAKVNPGILAETQTLTEGRTESSDPDRPEVLAETETITKASGETHDSDAGRYAGLVEWVPGSRRPLLFRDAKLAIAAAPILGYDRVLDMATDANGSLVVGSHGDLVLRETMTRTAVVNESNDTDA